MKDILRAVATFAVAAVAGVAAQVVAMRQGSDVQSAGTFATLVTLGTGLFLCQLKDKKKETEQ